MSAALPALFVATLRTALADAHAVREALAEVAGAFEGEQRGEMLTKIDQLEELELALRVVLRDQTEGVQPWKL